MSLGTQVPLFGLRKFGPEELLQKYSHLTRKAFKRKEGTIPVIIPARNEEMDLPACLVSLANSVRPVHPVVVVNCSNDRTKEFALELGATTLEIDGVKKIGATQYGIRTVIEQGFLSDREHKIILFTDADTILPRRWSLHLSRRLTKAFAIAPQKGAAIFGSAAYLHGPSMLADLAQCLHGFYLDISYAIQRKQPLVRGANYGIILDTANTILSTFENLNPRQIYRDDVKIHQKLHEAGVQILRALHPETVIITRGDRATSLAEFFKNIYQPGYEKHAYDVQYSLKKCSKNGMKRQA